MHSVRFVRNARNFTSRVGLGKRDGIFVSPLSLSRSLSWLDEECEREEEGEKRFSSFRRDDAERECALYGALCSPPMMDRVRWIIIWMRIACLGVIFISKFCRVGARLKSEYIG